MLLFALKIFSNIVFNWEGPYYIPHNHTIVPSSEKIAQYPIVELNFKASLLMSCNICL